jgi:hypothetical protein
LGKNTNAMGHHNHVSNFFWRTCPARVRGSLCSGAKAFTLLLALGVSAAHGADSGRVLMKISRDGGPENVRYGFFDEVTGERVARLRIGRVNLAYGKQGMFRVAWKPRAVLQGVALSISDEQAWASVCGKLAETFDTLSGHGALELREVVITRLGKFAQRIEAPMAEFSAAGELILPEARLESGEQGRMTLFLRGPEAGRILFLASHPPNPASPPAGSHPPAAAPPPPP